MTQASPLITILGPTASGKTSVAAHLAFMLGGVIFSGDSRQVYRGMDVGTGKDLADYVVRGVSIPYYLIDICDPGERYNIFRYRRDFQDAYTRLPPQTPKIVCGGSGLYIEAILRGYDLPDVPEDKALRQQLETLDLSTLCAKLAEYGPLHNTTDTTNKRRTIRVIEIAEYRRQHPQSEDFDTFQPLLGPCYVLDISREERRERISRRLDERLKGGMVEEVEALLERGISAQSLIYYGLEYKYVTEYLLGIHTFEQMHTLLETAIHQFAKRQMTWIRGMERRGIALTYITPSADPGDTAHRIRSDLKERGVV